jgi:hypothetical protein
MGLSYVDRMPTAWEYWLRGYRSSYVRIHLKGNPRPIGGIFGQESFGSTEPNGADLFILEVAPLDEGRDSPSQHEGLIDE